ncbi:MAG: peroxiredoxin [Pseudomonadota bacterium]
MSMLVNQSAPDFSLMDDAGQVFTLSEHRGQRLLLVFYPGDNTPVCTAQLCDYRDGIEVFDGLGVQVVGISADDTESHRQFRAQHELPFVLLSDNDLRVAEAYGCKGLLGMKRGVFFLDEAHVVRYGHVESVAVFRRKRDELVQIIQTL